MLELAARANARLIRSRSSVYHHEALHGADTGTRVTSFESQSADARSDVERRRSSQRCQRHTLATYERGDPLRTRLEGYVQRAFALKHGAHIRSFMPTLVALQGRDERICGVAGVRSAAAEHLFLERYLTQPIEAALSERVGMQIPREQIVEVGNLASLSCRAAFHLVAMLPNLLLERGHAWIAFTATDAVRSILSQSNAPVIELCTASADKVSDCGDEWGRYYEHDPKVLAGWLPHGAAFTCSKGVSRDA